MATGPAKFGQCKLCGEPAALVNSHIIPRAFFDLKPTEPTTLFSNTPGQYPKKAPDAVYDRIVCDSCERSFSLYDDYAIKTLKLNLAHYRRVQQFGGPPTLIASNIDYRLLKLFCVSVLWRASVSMHPFYKRVQLGPLEKKAKEILASGQPGIANEFAAWWSFFDIDWEFPITDPFRERWSGVTAYRFYFGRVIGYFKADRKPTPQQFCDIEIAQNRDLILVGRDFQKSKDLQTARRLMQTAIGIDKHPIRRRS